MRTLDPVEKEFLKPAVTRFDVGDTVDVHVKIVEGDKERIQIFSGIVIARRHQGLSETFTVRRIVQGEGVERIFPVHSPRVATIEVKKQGKVRRAKLHYLRERVGRSTKVEERTGSAEAVAATAREAKAEAVKAAEAAKEAAAKAEPKPEPKSEKKETPAKK
ncbi:MAG TPA: 50S ribosomal protein L19 [Planctomycetota bacterium]|nr:50S ribosomal protein L19 [Planctomycetota bacterium]